LSATFAGDGTYAASSDTSHTFTVTPEESTTTFTGPTVVLKGSGKATLKARLLEDGNTQVPLVGQSVKLTLGSASCTSSTDSTGTASCTLTPAGTLGSQPLSAAFAGNAFYKPSADNSATATVFAFPTQGTFVLGDKTVAAATPSTTVTWWSSNWAGLNVLSGGPAPSSFKGFAGTVNTLPTATPASACSGTWVTSGGGSPPPPTTVPSYMGVLVASKAAKSGTNIAGNFQKIVVVKTNPGYTGSTTSPGTGTIVATFCP
jgi:hypothetical protein